MQAHGVGAPMILATHIDIPKASFMDGSGWAVDSGADILLTPIADGQLSFPYARRHCHPRFADAIQTLGRESLLLEISSVRGLAMSLDDDGLSLLCHSIAVCHWAPGMIWRLEGSASSLITRV